MKNFSTLLDCFVLCSRMDSPILLKYPSEKQELPSGKDQKYDTQEGSRPRDRMVQVAAHVALTYGLGFRVQGLGFRV